MRNVVLFALALCLVGAAACGGAADNALTSAVSAQSDDEMPEAAIPCGSGYCPSDAYTCCQNNPNAPAECCLTGKQACYSGGGGLSGWPAFNGCSPIQCGSGKKLCEGTLSNICCDADQSCGTSWGVAYCKTNTCAADKRCLDGKLCCQGSNTCTAFRNVEYCADNCAAQGMETCKLQGDYYGSESFHKCCPTGTCQHHPDGWPFCDTSQSEENTSTPQTASTAQ